jgi:hypothetical protein
MSAVLDVSRPTPLRLSGFLFTAVGGLLIALGAISDWATVVLLGGKFENSATPGIDVAEGKVALGLGVLVLIVIVSIRLARTTSVRRALALIILIASVSALAIGIIDLLGAESRFGGYALDNIARSVAEKDNIPVAEARQRAQALVDTEGSIDLGVGLWLVVAGGAIGTIGGLLDLAWVGQRRLAAMSADIGAAD